jgi:hypothetical protein
LSSVLKAYRNPFERSFIEDVYCVEVVMIFLFEYKRAIWRWWLTNFGQKKSPKNILGLFEVF